MFCDEIYQEIIKDRVFYDQPDESRELGVQRGGITFSGGEPLLQFGVLEPLLASLKDEHVHICVETSLFVPKDKLSIALKYVDLFYVDIKMLDDEQCRKILGGNLKQYLSNMEYLFSMEKQVVFRIPIVGGYTDNNANINNICKLLIAYKPRKIELIKEHNLGSSKYFSLNKNPLCLDKISNEDMVRIKMYITSEVPIIVEICKI